MPLIIQCWTDHVEELFEAEINHHRKPIVMRSRTLGVRHKNENVHTWSKLKGKEVLQCTDCWAGVRRAYKEQQLEKLGLHCGLSIQYKGTDR